MKLYEIDERLETLLLLPDGNSVDTETGEVFSADAIAELEMDRDKKIEGCLLFIKNQEAEEKAIKEEAEKLLARAKTCSNAAARTKYYVQRSLAGEIFSTKKVAVSYKASEAVEVSCAAEKLPKEYQTVKVDVKPNKTELKKAIKAGAVIEGVVLVQRQNMQIK